MILIEYINRKKMTYEKSNPLYIINAKQYWSSKK